MHNNKIVEKVS